MIRSFAFTTQGRVRQQDIDIAQMPSVLADANLFLWVDFEKPSAEETKAVLEGLFHFHPLSIEDCILPSPLPNVEEYNPGPEDKFDPYLFIILHAVDYNRQDGVFATSELNLFLGKNFLVTYHDVPLRTITSIEGRCTSGAMEIARAPDRLAHTLVDALVENYKPALEELALEISELEQKALQHPVKGTMGKIL